MPSSRRSSAAGRRSCCSSRTLPRTTPCRCSTATRTSCAVSTMTSRAPPPWPWAASSPPARPPVPSSPRNGLPSSVPAAPVAASPSRSWPRWRPRGWRMRRRVAGSSWWIASASSPTRSRTSSTSSVVYPNRWSALPTGRWGTTSPCWRWWNTVARTSSSGSPASRGCSPKRWWRPCTSTVPVPSSSRSPTPPPGSRRPRQIWSAGPMVRLWWRPAARLHPWSTRASATSSPSATTPLSSRGSALASSPPARPGWPMPCWCRPAVRWPSARRWWKGKRGHCCRIWRTFTRSPVTSPKW